MSDGKPPFNKDIGSHCKAALLSGSPGVGKTTAATICSQVSHQNWDISATLNDFSAGAVTF